MKLAAILALVVAAAIPGSLLAQPPIKDATVDELADRLAPPLDASRGGRNLVPQPKPQGVDLVVNFEFDSARLQPASLPLLEKLAEAMKTPRLLEMKFQVEGHTDAKGGAQYNEALSLRRAQSVVAFLESRGIVRGRLEPAGKGFAEPLDKSNPNAAENRRVRISPKP